MNGKAIGFFCLLTLLGGCALGGKAPVDPVTKVYEDLNALKGAANAYRQEFSRLPPDGNDASFGKALISQGVIESFPSAPQAIRREGWAAQIFGYEFYGKHDDLAGDSQMDSALSLIGVTEEACRRYNEQFAGLGPVVPVYRETGYLRDRRTYCIDFGANSRFSILLLHEVR